jgi:hypothetical protein
MLDAMINDSTIHLEDNTCFDYNGFTNEVEEHDPDDTIPDMVHELFLAEDGGQKSMFATILDEMKQQLYPGSASTRFSFIVKLLHIKSFYKISSVGFNAILKLLSLTFPNCSLPISYAATKKLLSVLGLGYDSIHVCPNNCVLFWKDYAKFDECPVCGSSRWGTTKTSTSESIASFSIDSKVVAGLCFQKLAEHAQWHKLKRKEVENELNHPADGEPWKDFDRNYGWFAADARNN